MQYLFRASQSGRGVLHFALHAHAASCNSHRGYCASRGVRCRAGHRVHAFVSGARGGKWENILWNGPKLPVRHRAHHFEQQRVGIAVYQRLAGRSVQLRHRHPEYAHRACILQSWLLAVQGVRSHAAVFFKAVQRLVSRQLRAVLEGRRIRFRDVFVGWVCRMHLEKWSHALQVGLDRLWLGFRMLSRELQCERSPLSFQVFVLLQYDDGWPAAVLAGNRELHPAVRADHEILRRWDETDVGG